VIAEEDAELEREMTRLEVLKWKAMVERIMASSRNLARQGERYRKRAEETCELAWSCTAVSTAGMICISVSMLEAETAKRSELTKSSTTSGRARVHTGRGEAVAGGQAEREGSHDAV
jgi:hypothetical protein